MVRAVQRSAGADAVRILQRSAEVDAVRILQKSAEVDAVGTLQKFREKSTKHILTWNHLPANCTTASDLEHNH